MTFGQGMYSYLSQKSFSMTKINIAHIKFAKYKMFACKSPSKLSVRQSKLKADCSQKGESTGILLFPSIDFRQTDEKASYKYEMHLSDKYLLF